MIDTWQVISPPKQIILLSKPIKVLNIRESILLIEKGIKRSTIFIEKKHRVYQRDIFQPKGQSERVASLFFVFEIPV